MSALPDQADGHHVLVIIDTDQSSRCEQALRAAVGIAMSCASLRVAVTPAAWLCCASTFCQRCIATLESFDHRVRIISLRDAALLQRPRCRTEVWR